MSLGLVVYDLDGTLIDSAAHIAHTVNRTRAKLGLSPMTLAEVRPCIGDGAKRLVEKAFFGWLGADARPTYSVIGKDGPSFPAVFEQFFEIYLQDPASGLELMEGALEGLERLERHGVVQAVLTNKPHAVTELVMKGLGIDRFMAVTYGPGAIVDGVELAPKPDPTGLLAIMKQTGVLPADTVMVGDGIQDAKVAINGGVRCVAIAESMAARRAFEALPRRPIAIVDTLREANDVVWGLIG
jgi:phosphoglycolate phosphatase-like HAD superfamily hydrolase